MKKSLSFVTSLLLVLALSACSLLGSPIAEKVASVVDDYCNEPFAARQLYRDTVNEELATEGHSIEVKCAGDPDVVGAIGGPVALDLVAAVDTFCVSRDAAVLSTRHDVAVRCRDPGEGGQWKG